MGRQAARRPCPSCSRGLVAVPVTCQSDRTCPRVRVVAVLQSGDNVPWSGTFPFLT